MGQVDYLIALFRKDQCIRLIRTECNVLPQTATIEEAIIALRDKKIDYVCLIDEKESFVGLITEGSIAQWVGKNINLDEKALASTIMITDLICMESHKPISKLVMTMYHHTFQHIPITVQGKVVGVVSSRDFVHYLIDYFAESVYNILPDQPIQKDREGA
jgi:CBS domain-containing protein